MKKQPSIQTLGELKQSGYAPKSLKTELRTNLIHHMERGTNPFSGIIGYDETVLPDVQRAILSGHSINLLGLRGQAKTRIARTLTALLDEWIPCIDGSELNDDPLQPISHAAHDALALHGDLTPIRWMHRADRYVEKLATPDVSVADLIGDIDPIKAANLKLPYSDERVIHFGLIPRSHRCIFVINELPDLQARIQVSLFNILQEGDIQIRGFQLRLPLDIQFVFTANPEDYTNRGSIITPLKDRIQSQIITHYPKSIALGMEITELEARHTKEQLKRVTVAPFLRELIEMVAFEARESEYVDQKSGVSARLTISAMENLVSCAERRAIINKEKKTIIDHLAAENIQLQIDSSRDEYANLLYSIPVLHEIVDKYCPGIQDEERLMMMEFVLHGLAEFSVIGKTVMDSSIEFSDIMNDIFRDDTTDKD